MANFCFDENEYWIQYDSHMKSHYNIKKEYYTDLIDSFQAALPEKKVSDNVRLKKYISRENSQIQEYLRKGKSTQNISKKIRYLQKVKNLMNDILKQD